MAKSTELRRAEEKLNMTKMEKFKNHWYYHKWFYVAGVAGIALVIWILSSTLFATRADYNIGFITNSYMPAEILEEMENELSKVADDRNGDGEGMLTFNHYQISFDENADPNTVIANQTRLVANISSHEQMIYIFDDPTIYKGYFEGLISTNDGELLSAEGEFEASDFGAPLSDVEIFHNLDSYDYLKDMRILMADEDFIKSLEKDDYTTYYEDSKLYLERILGN